MSGRYIDADALKKSYGMADKCSDCVTNSRDCQFNFTFTKMDFCGWIDDEPTADVVEVVHGEWGSHGECPFCGYLRQWEEDNFCGNCGARMQERREDERLNKKTGCD